MLKKVKDERLTKKELKCIKGLAILQNVVIFGILVYQTIQKDVPEKGTRLNFYFCATFHGFGLFV